MTYAVLCSDSKACTAAPRKSTNSSERSQVRTYAFYITVIHLYSLYFFATIVAPDLPPSVFLLTWYLVTFNLVIAIAFFIIIIRFVRAL